MYAKLQQVARDIRALVTKLDGEGWDRLRALRLLHAVEQLAGAADALGWLEVAGRARDIAELLAARVQRREAPPPAGLSGLADTSPLGLGRPLSAMLANLLARIAVGPLPEGLEEGYLPADPGEWRILLAGPDLNRVPWAPELLETMGFRVARVPTVLAEDLSDPRTVLLVAAGELGGLPPLAAVPNNPRQPQGAILVALVADEDPSILIAARRAGAALLLPQPLDGIRLVKELCGVAWSPRSPFRVMVVDDDRASLQYHGQQLEAAGFLVELVQAPLEALGRMDVFCPHVLVMDVEMPDCRGPELAALCRSRVADGDVPVIYLSGFSDAARQVEARLSGGGDYLIKPVDPQVLCSAVLARARQRFRVEGMVREQNGAAQRLDHLLKALQVHALVSVTAPDGAILEANQKFCEVSGYGRAELIGRNHRLIRSGHHSPAFFEEMWATISQGRIWQGEIRNRRKDGSEYWVQTTILPVCDAQGGVTEFVSVRTDITAQKTVQGESQRQSRLLDLLRNGLQHYLTTQDLRESVALLLTGFCTLTEAQQGFAVEIDASHPADAPLELAAWGDAVLAREELLALAQQVAAAGETREAGENALHRIGLPVYHGNLLAGVVCLAGSAAAMGAAAGGLYSPFLATLASILEAARLRRYQQKVVDELDRARNIAERANAAKAHFLAGFGHELRTPLNAILGHAQLLLLDCPDPRVKGQVSEIARAGATFSQLISTLMEQADEGAAATGLLIPEQGVLPPAAGLVPRRRVLVAEDSLANQVVLKWQLELLGLEVTLASQGEEALALWRQGGFDLILLDCHMPVTDGIQVAIAIREQERRTGVHLPILGITADNDPREQAACFDAGMDDLLLKPIEFDAMEKAVGHWLGQGSGSSGSLAPPARPESPPGAADLPELDLAVLARVVGSRDGRQASALLSVFVEAARTDMEPLGEHLARGDAQAAAALAHKLKSSAATVGAQRFAHGIRAVESLCRQGDCAGAGDGIPALVASLQALDTQLHRLSQEGLPYPETPVGTAGLLRRVLVVAEDADLRQRIGLGLSDVAEADVIPVSDPAAALRTLDALDDCDLVIHCPSADPDAPDLADGLLGALAARRFSGLVQLLCPGDWPPQQGERVCLAWRQRGLEVQAISAWPGTRQGLEALLGQWARRRGLGMSLPRPGQP